MYNMLELIGASSSINPTIALEKQITGNVFGKAYGIETFIQFSKSIVDFTAKYNYGRSMRQASVINNDTWYPFKYERPHDVNLNLSIRLGKKWTAIASWIYTNGNNINIPNSEYASIYTTYFTDWYINQPITAFNQNQVLQYNNKNNYRLPANHHLDIGFTCKKSRPRIKQEFNISIFNIYNRLNVFTLYKEYKPNNGEAKKSNFKKVTLMPIMPFFSYAIKI